MHCIKIRHPAARACTTRRHEHTRGALFACRRKAYDATGSLQDCEDISGDFAELYQKYRAMYVVTEDDIDTFAVRGVWGGGMVWCGAG